MLRSAWEPARGDLKRDPVMVTIPAGNIKPSAHDFTTIKLILMFARSKGYREGIERASSAYSEAEINRRVAMRKT